jgi:hypothetical protein
VFLDMHKHVAERVQAGTVGYTFVLTGGLMEVTLGSNIGAFDFKNARATIWGTGVVAEKSIRLVGKGVFSTGMSRGITVVRNVVRCGLIVERTRGQCPKGVETRRCPWWRRLVVLSEWVYAHSLDGSTPRLTRFAAHNTR